MAVGAYQHSTLQDLVDQLAQDLGDSSKVFFTTTELQRALVEALRLTNTLTARSRYTLNLNCTAGTAWYDLAAMAPTALGSTVTDRTTIENMQYRLMETVEPAAGVGMKEQYTFAQLLRSLQQSRDRFLVETESTITRRSTLATIDPPSGTLELDESIAKVVRATWTHDNGRTTVLRNSSDEGTMSAVNLDRRLQSGTPRRWSVIARPQLTIALDPIPIDAHAPSTALRLYTVEVGSTLSTTANANAGTVMGLPDDLSAGAMWDALELTLSKHGLGHDQNRAQFASQLGTLYRSVASQMPTVLQVAVNGKDVRTGQVAHLDAKNVNWESANRGIPTRAAILGDWLGLYPVPDDIHSVEVTLVAKLTTPALTDYVQVGREYLSGILSWAKQLLLFKVGGAPLARAASTAGLLIDQARSFNEDRTRSCQYLTEFLGTGLASAPTIPRATPPADMSGDLRDDASTRNERSRNPRYTQYSRPIGGQ